MTGENSPAASKSPENGPDHPVRNLGEFSPDPGHRVSDQIFLCRKINYGKNGNFVRYEPISFPSKADLKSALIAVTDHWKRLRTDSETPLCPEDQCRLGKTIDFLC